MHLIIFLELFNRSAATRAVARNISKDYGGIWHADFLHKLKSFKNAGQMFSLTIYYLVGKKRLRMVLDRKSLQEYPVNIGLSQGSTLGPKLFPV